MVVPRACHNCRKRRLRCDQSVPACHKCSSTGQECLGYGKFYKWVDNPPPPARVLREPFAHPSLRSRGHTEVQLDNLEYDSRNLSFYERAEPWALPNFSLLDPLLQDLDQTSRRYLNYYTTRFCEDLVIYDSPRRGANPFRDLVPISQKYPFLREIIIAVSALHFSNAVRWHKSPRLVIDAVVDAMRARHRAIKSLQAVIESQTILDDAEVDEGGKDVLLAAVLFFVNFALIDSGKGGWRAHMNFVGRLLSTRTINPIASEAGLLPGTNHTIDFATSEPLLSLSLTHRPAPSSHSLVIGDCIASDSMAYYIWSVALDSLISSGTRTALGPLAYDDNNADILRILLRTEANSYHSCPSQLLYAIFRTSQLARDIRTSDAGLLNEQQMQSCLELLNEIQSFDGDAWAAEVCAKVAAATGYLDEVELHYRKHIAATFRAAVYLYVLLVAPPELQDQVYRRQSIMESEDDKFPSLPTTTELAAAILHHLSFIPPDSPLFKFATWPIFLLGVETADPSRRTWALDRLRDMRNLCPWGMITSTMETLGEIWRIRDKSAADEKSQSDESGLVEHSITSLREGDSRNWLVRLQGIEIDCLIV
ncbi:fungal-specific transcription factor domain-containing protein [Hypomontagnella submonticulosa]|nr:fungal-specific transcription factor domain-containing protein [Hypomontagnella submonticulosa]